MMNTLFHSPGQVATIVLQVKGSDGYRANSLTTPIVNNIYFPNVNNIDGYTLLDGYTAVPMTKLTTGIYYVYVTLPSGATAVGSYLVDVSWTNPDSSVGRDLSQIVITAPNGLYFVGSG